MLTAWEYNASSAQPFVYSSSRWIAKSTNLWQWRNPALSYSFGYAVNEYYRHNKQCNILWVDGHVTSIVASIGKDVPGAWYGGS
jgi:prepilin-type processing-associated H-X9-DG protein